MLFLVLLAPVAQRIEHWPPEPGARVRVPSGAFYDWVILKKVWLPSLLGFLFIIARLAKSIEAIS
jgi:hypothetical protein